MNIKSKSLKPLNRKAYKTQRNPFLNNFNQRKEKQFKRRQLGKMYSDHFKSQIPERGDETSRSRSKEKSLRNPYLRE
jgi:hypothetical protein